MMGRCGVEPCHLSLSYLLYIEFFPVGIMQSEHVCNKYILEKKEWGNSRKNGNAITRAITAVIICGGDIFHTM